MGSTWFLPVSRTHVTVICHWLLWILSWKSLSSASWRDPTWLSNLAFNCCKLFSCLFFFFFSPWSLLPQILHTFLLCQQLDRDARDIFFPWRVLCMEMASPASFPHGMPCQLPWLLNLADVEGRCHAPAVGSGLHCPWESSAAWFPLTGFSCHRKGWVSDKSPACHCVDQTLYFCLLVFLHYWVLGSLLLLLWGSLVLVVVFLSPVPLPVGISLPFPPSLGSSAVSVCDHWHLLWDIGENGGSLWNVWSLLSCQVGCCTGCHLDGSCLRFHWTLGEPRDWYDSQASWEALLLHPLPREDESHPLSLSWWDAGNVLGAILAMPFRSVDGGSVFCETEGSSTVISSRGLLSKHTSVLRR